MGMFDEPEARGTGGLDPQKVGKVGSKVIKHVFRALPLIRIVSLGAILVVAVVLGKGLVETVANGTYQISPHFQFDV